MKIWFLALKKNPIISLLIFPVLLLLVSWYYHFNQILPLPPQSIHFWRQTDCLSFTLNYMQEGRGILHPSINYIGVRGDGQVASDFPLIYYLVGKLWQLFGQHEWIYRLLVFLIFGTGLTFFYSVLKDFIKDTIWSVIVCLLLFSSPMIAYYSCNFLVNLPALSFEIIGLSFFYLFYKKKSLKYLWFSCASYMVGGLIKIPALTTFVIICFLYLSELTGIIKYKKEGKIFTSTIKSLYPILMVIVAEVSWILYLNHYNQGNGGLFLVGIYPIWGLSKPEIRNIIKIFFDYWFTQHFSRALHYVSLAMLLWVFFNIRRLTPVIRSYVILVFIGVWLYIFLWFQALLHHDYYVTNIYIYFLITWAVGLKLLIDRFPKVVKSVWLKLVVVLFLCYNIHYCGKEINVRYNGWKNYSYKQYFKGLVDLKPVIREKGISRKDTVIILGDETINGALYYLDLKGWTNYGGYMNNMDSVKIDRAIHGGAKYMIMLDSTWQEKDFVKPFTHHLFLQQGGYKVFKLK